MSIRNFDKLFCPQSIAIIGASERPGSIGSVLTHNVIAAGFSGQIWAVNPHYRTLHGIDCVAAIGDLPAAPDLVVIATPFATVPAILAQLAERGTRAAVIVSAATLADTSDSADQQRILQEISKPYLMRLVGPNCLGLMVPRLGLNASFSHLAPRAGKLAFVTQSGAIVTAMIDWAQTRDIGFSHIVSLGDMCDVDFGDMLDYLANDPDTDAILLYIEAVSGARKFVSAARAAARSKPVIVVKGGRFSAGARAAATHTGALMGSDAVYDAVFKRTGMVRVYSLQELFNAAETLGHTKRLPGERIAILTNGGGLAVLAADALAEQGGTLATLEQGSISALSQLLPSNWSHTNPVDIIGDATAQRFAAAATIVAADQNVDALLVMHCPTAVCTGAAAASALLAALPSRDRPLLLTSWVGGDSARTARALFSQASVATYATPEEAVRGFMYTVAHARGQRILMETPAAAQPLPPADTPRVAAILGAAVAACRDWLDATDTRTVLDAYGIATVHATLVADAEAAGVAAAATGGLVALKIRSPDLPHKTDVGGVVLDLCGAEATQAAARAMLAQIRLSHPEARLEGFSVEPMVRRRDGFELIIGMSCDAQFGPVIAFGQGGTAVETIDDRALALPPLNQHLAAALISETRIARLLGGARGLPAADVNAIAQAIVNLSRLVCDFPAIAEMDINPLFADARGVIALDARIRVAATTEQAAQRLAIKPYPRELEEAIALPDGRTLLLRPVCPEDEPALRRAFSTLSKEEIYLRFFAPLKSLSHAMAARFTQIDYDREMTLILTDAGAPGTTDYYGSVNLICDPDRQRGEFAILVRHDMSGQGLGTLLMQRIITYARSRGVGEIVGEVLQQNHIMLGLCQELGFTRQSNPRDPGVIAVRLDLHSN